MAVRTQHSSSYFFGNSNGQEDNDCSLQPQQVSSVDFIQLSSAAAPMNPPPQAIDLNELLQNHNQLKSTVAPTGLRLSHEHSQNQEELLSTFSMLSGDLSGEYKRQRYELDMFLQTQSEELWRNLASNRERQHVELLYAAEELVRRRVREKETELEKATRRHAELKARAAQLAEEARTWQLRAATREAEVSSLQNHIQKVIASQRTAANQSMIGGDGEEAEDAESVFVDPERVEMNGPSCRICRRKPATVMALPCRHLVLCKGCNGGGDVRACPICLAVKSSGVEVLFS